jgi:hypothetical protein
MTALLSGFIQSQALFTFAKLDLATLLLAGPRPAAALAEATRTNALQLDRVLRYLASVDVVSLDPDGFFAITPFGATLASGTPGSVRDLAIFWMETHYEAFAEFLASVRTGTPAFDLRFGQVFGDWMAARPDQGARLAGAMSAVAQGMKADLLAGYRLPGGEVVADIGGADGTLLATLLAHDPGRRGIVLDVDHVVATAGPRLAELGMTERIEARAGDFFQSVPAADVYVLSTVLHDWNDEKCGKILANIAAAAHPGAHVVVMDCVLPEGNEPHPGRVSDLAMIGMSCGRERRLSELAGLLAAAGFAVRRRLCGSAGNPFSIVEATSTSAGE